MVGAFAALVTVSAEALAQRNATDPWDPSAREFGRSLDAPNVPGDTRNATLDALNKILSSSKLSAFDRSIYLSIRAYQLSKVGREAESAGRLECRWQRGQLPDAIRELVLDDQRMRNEICWSVFDV